MGAWGTGIFEDDAAADFAGEVARAKDSSLLYDAFSQATQASDTLEYDAGAHALAAAEIVAAMGGHPANLLPPAAATWVANHRHEFSQALCSQAIESVKRVTESSELAELWAESDEGELWKANVADLQGRLKTLSG